MESGPGSSKIEKIRLDSLRVPVVGKAQRPFHAMKAAHYTPTAFPS